MSGSPEDEAKKEAQKWAEMAARMKVSVDNSFEREGAPAKLARKC
jgi:hypothetical protein